MELPAAHKENLMDLNVNAHLKLEMVLNDDYDAEYDDEIRFNDMICYDSGENSNDNENDLTGIPNHEINSQKQQSSSARSFESGNLTAYQKRSNAEQMRKYRARIRSDPERYQQYLARERMRNNERKYEKKIKTAQQKAFELGLPYIILEESSAPRRGRRPKYPREEAFLPIKFDHADPNSFQIDTYDGIPIISTRKSIFTNQMDHADPNLFEVDDDMPIMPLEVQLTESDEAYLECKPDLSALNIDKLMNQSRPALQTLLPQEVRDRERITTNTIELDHNYVKIKTEPVDEYSDHLIDVRQYSKNSAQKTKSSKLNRNELLKLQEQCRSFGSKISADATLSNDSPLTTNPTLRKPKSFRRTNTFSKQRMAVDSMQNDPIADSVEHEDFDDLFKELEEVAKQEQPKKVKSSKTSPSKQHGEFSLTVCMPVQPMIKTKNGSVHSEESQEHSSSDFVENVKKEPVTSDDDFGF